MSAPIGCAVPFAPLGSWACGHPAVRVYSPRSAVGSFREFEAASEGMDENID